MSGTQNSPEAHGKYILMQDHEGCGGKPMFWKSAGIVYLYYNPEISMWAVGRNACGSGELLRAADNAYSPDSIQTTWTENDHQSQSLWINIPKIQVAWANVSIL